MFSTSRTPHPFERDNLIDDLLFKGYGEKKVEASNMEMKPV
jgi:hypothetical protein